MENFSFYAMIRATMITAMEKHLAGKCLPSKRRGIFEGWCLVGKLCHVPRLFLSSFTCFLLAFLAIKQRNCNCEVINFFFDPYI